MNRRPIWQFFRLSFWPLDGTFWGIENKRGQVIVNLHGRNVKFIGGEGFEEIFISFN
jgi:hypothetical protein